MRLIDDVDRREVGVRKRDILLTVGCLTGAYRDRKFSEYDWENANSDGRRGVCGQCVGLELGVFCGFGSRG